STGDWLSRRLFKTRTTIREAQVLLDEWCQELNPHNPGERYTPGFFRRQWAAERAAMISTSQDMKIRQQLELGRLLCLQELARETWAEDTNNENGAADRLRRYQTIAADIVNQRKKVGLPESFSTLSGVAADLLLKVWYSKTEVRTRFLALRSEQRPLDPEKRAGGGSNLGQHEKERILDAIQRRTRTMKKILNTYNNFARSFREQFPDHPTSPVRRALRWATDIRDRLWDILHDLTHSQDPSSASIGSFVRHEILQTSSTRAKVTIVKGLLHNEFVRISQLQIRWHTKVMEVFANTRAQAGDEHLITRWILHVQIITQLRTNDFGSIKAGDFEHLMPHDQPNDHEGVGPIEHLEEVGDAPNDSDSDVDSEEWDNGIDEGMMQNIYNGLDNVPEEPR
ncbi:hypothetical protein DFH28DRAFT_901808, partial [Melampsora americana]